MSVKQRRSDVFDGVQFSPASQQSMESFFGSTFYGQVLRWYDTATQELFTTEQTGENIINVLQLLIGGNYVLVFPTDWVIKTFTDGTMSVLNDADYNATYVDHSILSSY
jgi:hypothetical protein